MLNIFLLALYNLKMYIYMIRKKGNKYILLSKDGSKKLGEFNTRKQAEQREKQILFFKNKK